MAITITPIRANAQSFQTEPQTTIEEVGDGNYFETIITTWNDPILPRAGLKKSASKTVNYKNSSGDVLWYVKVTGTFTYEKGISSRCTNSSV